MAGDYENKYEPLYDFLMKETRDDFILTFAEIEEILGFDLPRSAKRAEWWDDDTPEHPREQAQAIHQAGYDFTADAGRHQGSLPQAVDVAPQAMTSEQTHLTVMVFPGTQTLPLFAAQARGYFEKRGLSCRIEARAELRGAARGTRRGPLPNRPRRRRPVRGAGRGGEGRRHDRGRRRQRLQSSVRPAGDRAYRRFARANAGGRRRQHRLVVRALRHPQAARPLARRHRHP